MSIIYNRHEYTGDQYLVYKKKYTNLESHISIGQLFSVSFNPFFALFRPYNQ